jgi:hypothetical protein
MRHELEIGMQAESMLYALWQDLPLHSPMPVGNQVLEICNKGRLSTTSGPDFQGAEIVLDGQRLRGDIEIHLRSADWFLHMHHLNPAYNNVVLHLAWRTDNRIITTASGIAVKQLSLQTLEAFRPHLQPSDFDITTFFMQRFERKIRYCSALLEVHFAEDVLWILLARTLGYSANTESMELFARIFPLSRLRNIAQHYSVNRAFIRGVALGEKTEDDNATRRLLPRKTFVWQRTGRPANYPEKRLDYVADLFAKMQYVDFFAAIMSVLSARKESSYVLAALRKVMHIPGRRSAIGKERLLSYVINWLLPFGWLYHEENPAMQTYLLDLYWHLPPEKIRFSGLKHKAPATCAMESQAYTEYVEYARQHPLLLNEMYFAYGV